jgi:hypothetical protein
VKDKMQSPSVFWAASSPAAIRRVLQLVSNGAFNALYPKSGSAAAVRSGAAPHGAAEAVL